MIVPLIEKILASGEIRTVSEIGTGNGDVLSHLAQTYPSIRFVGADLSVANAQRKHHMSNLEFVAGYPLDLLRSGSLGGDLVFGSSTFVVYAPKELEAYPNALAAAHHILISDPVTFGNRHTHDPDPKLRHMDCKCGGITTSVT